MSGGNIPRVETKKRECWKFLDWRLNSENDSRVHGQPSFANTSITLKIENIFNLGALGLGAARARNEGGDQRVRKIIVSPFLFLGPLGLLIKEIIYLGDFLPLVSIICWYYLLWASPLLSLIHFH